MEKKRKRLAALFTLLFSTGIVLLLLFMYSFRTPLPLPEEEGVVIELGGGGGGGGSDTYDPVFDNINSSNANTGNLNENYVTQGTEAVNYSAGQTSTGNNNNSNNSNKVDNHITNFTWGQGTGTGNGNGSGTGSGTGSGNGTGTGSGDGPGVGPGSGPAYSLNGRSAKSIPKPKYTEDDQGKVVVTIWVDKQGNVTRAEPGAIGTTVSNPSLWNAAKTAAMQAKFSVNSNAPEVQKGTITYSFIKLN